MPFLCKSAKIPIPLHLLQVTFGCSEIYFFARVRNNLQAIIQIVALTLWF